LTAGGEPPSGDVGTVHCTPPLCPEKTSPLGDSSSLNIKKKKVNGNSNQMEKDGNY
jgi:hypothetical protein